MAIRRSLCTAILVALAGMGSASAVDYVSPMHVFSVGDVIGDFDGRTFATDPTILCTPTGSPTLPGTAPCPANIPPPQGGQTPTTGLYAIDSTFGFYVSDFVGAAEKQRDGDYAEGWLGNYVDPTTSTPGLLVADAPTDTFRVAPPLGTWCVGIGSEAVKCDSEHYSVMEHILTCHETVPYNPEILTTGLQPLLLDPATGQPIPDPANPGQFLRCQKLDNDLRLVVNGQLTSTPITLGPDGTPAELTPNESTVLSNIARSESYSITEKDDGKALYRWGNLVKRPNDVRLLARIPLPAEWKAPGAAFTVTRARLIVDHWITNNPNDQIRPEDLENEGATGRIPGSTGVLPRSIAVGDFLYSARNCYEGDGDFIPAGTVLQNGDFVTPVSDPLPFSSDLLAGFTNAWYTTIDREPFEWSYAQGGSQLPVDDGSLGALFSGPRWRLRANKFGQDIPGLEIPLIPCSAPPFQSNNIKYEIGARTTTELNLLDWSVPGASPLLDSRAWVDYNANPFITVDPLTGVSSNGTPMTDDFDLVVYIKGDRKPTVVYSAVLEISYESGAPGVVFANGFE
jgi:hypothetical protein